MSFSNFEQKKKKKKSLFSLKFKGLIILIFQLNTLVLHQDATATLYFDRYGIEGEKQKKASKWHFTFVI